VYLERGMVIECRFAHPQEQSLFVVNFCLSPPENDSGNAPTSLTSYCNVET